MLSRFWEKEPSPQYMVSHNTDNTYKMNSCPVVIGESSLKLIVVVLFTGSIEHSSLLRSKNHISSFAFSSFPLFPFGPLHYQFYMEWRLEWQRSSVPWTTWPSIRRYWSRFGSLYSVPSYIGLFLPFSIRQTCHACGSALGRCGLACEPGCVTTRTVRRYTRKSTKMYGILGVSCYLVCRCVYVRAVFVLLYIWLSFY
jgi:hypothetical protein